MFKAFVRQSEHKARIWHEGVKMTNAACDRGYNHGGNAREDFSRGA